MGWLFYLSCITPTLPGFPFLSCCIISVCEYDHPESYCKLEGDSSYSPKLPRKRKRKASSSRLSVFFASILLYSLANIANAFVTSIPVYAVLRFLSGIGLAVELGAAVTLVSESLPREHRGYASRIERKFEVKKVENIKYLMINFMLPCPLILRFYAIDPGTD
ncbi:MAG: MFS transporter [Oligoflexus sp.]|nr:MFS transporter [Oligoflexus sp.]